MEILLSVVIPIYNKEKFLHDCLESVCQILSHKVELVLVDDGSTDLSLQICEKYVDKNRNIRIIKQANSGVSSARNVGLNSSRGIWITFLDADDLLITDSWNRIVDKLNSSKADEIIFSYCYGNERIVEIKRNSNIYKNEQTNEIIKAMLSAGIAGDGFNMKNAKGLGGPIAKFIRRDFLQENAIQYDTELRRNEDYLFQFSCYSRSIEIETSDIVCYKVIEDQNGIRNSMDFDETYKNLFLFFQKFTKNRYIYNQYANEFPPFILNYTLSLISSGFTSYLKKKVSYNYFRKKINEFVNEEWTQYMLKNINLQELPVTKKIAFVLLKRRLLFLVGMEMYIWAKKKNR